MDFVLFVASGDDLTDEDTFGKMAPPPFNLDQFIRFANMAENSTAGPAAVVKIMDCSNHMIAAKKDAAFIAEVLLPHFDRLGLQPDLVLFDGSANVQAAGRLFAHHTGCLSAVGAEHRISCFFKDLANIPVIKQHVDNVKMLFNDVGSGSRHAPHAAFKKYSAIEHGGNMLQ